MTSSAATRGGVEPAHAGGWWLSLVGGIAWVVAALVILQFDQASVATAGVIIGIQFIGAGTQQIVLSARWPGRVMGALLLIAGVICIFNPAATFAGFADVLAFLFLLVGLNWTIEALVVRDSNPVWWLSLISGIVMIVAAFWTSGQLLFDKAYVLLVFAGIWALCHGVTDIVRAFMIRGAAR